MLTGLIIRPPWATVEPNKKIPDWFRELPAGKKLIGEANAQETRTRKALVDEIAALEKRLVAEHPALAKQCDEAKERVDAAVKVLADAQAVYRDALAARDALSHEIEVKTAQRRMQLRHSADESKLVAFRDELWALQEKARYILPSTETEDGKTWGSPRRVPKATNAYALERYRAALRAALHQLDALYESAEYDVTAAIEQIRASLPSLGEAERTMEKVAA